MSLFGTFLFKFFIVNWVLGIILIEWSLKNASKLRPKTEEQKKMA